MTLASWFWVIYVLSLLFGFWVEYTTGPNRFYGNARHVLFYVLIGLLGYRVFNSPLIH